MKAATIIGVAACGMIALAQACLACGDEGPPSHNYEASSDACPSVSDIKTMPFRDDWGVDAAYDRFRSDGDCEQVLIRALTSAKPMPDPNCPSYGGFVEADAAFFVLVEKYGVDIPDALPAKERARWKTRGIYGYYEYVEAPRHRAELKARLLALIDQAKKRRDGEQRK